MLSAMSFIYIKNMRGPKSTLRNIRFNMDMFWYFSINDYTLRIWMTAYKIQNLVYEWVSFSKFSQTWAKIGLDIRKFGKYCVILLKISPKIEQIGTLMGHFFLKNSYFYGSTFKVRGSTSLPKPILSTPGVLRWLTFHFWNSKATDPRVVTRSLIWAGM